jgi:hypothetical protein
MRSLIFLSLPLLAFSEVQPAHSRLDVGFALGKVPTPALNDLGTKAKFTLTAGSRDANGADLLALTDGQVPKGDDEPRSNFFLDSQTKQGRLVAELEAATELASVATYSWHSDSRAPQHYRLYGTAQTTADAAQEKDWQLLGEVDTQASGAGQHGVVITGEGGKPLGKFQKLLFIIEPNADRRGFGHTFFSEIDILATDGPPVARYTPPQKILHHFDGPEVSGKKLHVTLDATASPDLVPWFRETTMPQLMQWYPKVAKLISLPGKTPPAPSSYSIVLQEGQIMPGRDGIPAFAVGDRIVVSSKFMRAERDRESLGCLIHEMVHVVQFGAGQRARNAPTWLYEGATDYIRWFLYEPERKGAVIRDASKVRYNDSYRTTANFLDWVARNHCAEILQRVHEAVHSGYDVAQWKTWTGKDVAELEAAWKAEATKAK